MPKDKGQITQWPKDKIQITQWPKDKVQNDKERSTKHTYKTKDQVTRTPLTTGMNSGAYSTDSGQKYSNASDFPYIFHIKLRFFK